MLLSKVNGGGVTGSRVDGSCAVEEDTGVCEKGFEDGVETEMGHCTLVQVEVSEVGGSEQKVVECVGGAVRDVVVAAQR